MENDVIEIDIKFLLYKIAKEYKKVLIGSLIVGLLACGFKAIKIFSVTANSEKYQAIYDSYQEEYQKYLDDIDLKKTQIELINRTLDSQKEYNRNSILMKINPYEENVGTFSASFSNKAVIPTYVNYYNSDEFYNDLVSIAGAICDVKYVSELFNISISDNTIYFETVGENEVEINNLYKATVQATNAFSKKVSNEIYHEISFSELSVDVKADSELATAQLNNTNREKTYDSNITTLNNELKALKQPVFEYSKSQIAKSLSKFLLIGFVCGLFLICFAYAMLIIFSSRVYGDSYIKQLGLDIVCTIALIDFDIIDKLFGYDAKETDFENQCALLATNLGLLKGKKADKVVGLSHTGNPALSNEICKQVGKNKKVTLVSLGDISSEPDALNKVDKYENFVILVEDGVTRKDNLKEQIKILSGLNKNVTGVIYVK